MLFISRMDGFSGMHIIQSFSNRLDAYTTTNEDTQGKRGNLNQKFCNRIVNNKLKSLKVAKWRKDEWRMIKDEWRMMKDEWTMMKDEWRIMKDEGCSTVNKEPQVRSPAFFS